MTGTPFRFASDTVKGALIKPQGYKPHGSTSCANDSRTCRGKCGGWSGYCGLHQGPETDFTVRLTVVDQKAFDNDTVCTTFSRTAGAELRGHVRLRTNVSGTKTWKRVASSFSERDECGKVRSPARL